ncbi:MAG: hypothetical protein IKQ89_00240 [Muribaculaceae bacterium]|nr:hypothetical protein [Muribaculaceae bacterium]
MSAPTHSLASNRPVAQRTLQQQKSLAIMAGDFFIASIVAIYYCPVKVQGILQFCFWRASIAACRDAPRRVVRDENDEKRTVPFSSPSHHPENHCFSTEGAYFSKKHPQRLFIGIAHA